LIHGARIAVAVAPVSEILGVEGVALAGPLPDEVQQVRSRFKAGGIDRAD
jgi:hypothetical protein